jgi:hypothetical protein
MRTGLVFAMCLVAAPALASVEYDIPTPIPSMDPRGREATEFMNIELRAGMMDRRAYEALMAMDFLKNLIQGVVEPFPHRPHQQPKMMPED